MVFRLRIGKLRSFYKYIKRFLLWGKNGKKKKNFQKDWKNKWIKSGDQQTLFMLVLSDQIIILFPADTFSRKQLIFRPHYKRNKYKLLEKRSCMSVWVCFAPTTQM